MICPGCRNNIKDGTPFCPKCGTRLLQNRQNTAAQQPGFQGYLAAQQPGYQGQHPAQQPGYQGQYAAPQPVPPPVAAPAEEKSTNTALILAICAAVVLVLVIAVLAVIFLQKDDSAAQPATDTQPVTTEKETTYEESLAAPETEPPVEHTYELVMADCTWEEARQACIARGGHLVTITTDDEEQTIIRMAEDAGARYVWIGGYTEVYGEDIDCYWVTGEGFYYEDWLGPYEPTGQDLDGTPERCLMLWTVEKYGSWGWNDNRNDLSAFSNYTGKMCYVCEYGDGFADEIAP